MDSSQIEPKQLETSYQRGRKRRRKTWNNRLSQPEKPGRHHDWRPPSPISSSDTKLEVAHANAATEKGRKFLFATRPVPSDLMQRRWILTREVDGEDGKDDGVLHADQRRIGWIGSTAHLLFSSVLYAGTCSSTSCRAQNWLHLQHWSFCGLRNTDSCSYSRCSQTCFSSLLREETSHSFLLSSLVIYKMFMVLRTLETTRLGAAAFLLHLTSLHCLSGGDWVSLTPAENLFALHNAFWHVLRPASWSRRGRKPACKIESNERPPLLDLSMCRIPFSTVNFE